MKDDRGTADAPSAAAIGRRLEATRQRTLDIVEPVSDAGLRRQHSSLMSPIVWDLGHIAEFEDLWLVRRLGEVAGEADLPATFDAMRTPRSDRGSLDLPDRDAVLGRLSEVRQRALDRLGRVDLSRSDRLLAGGFAYELVREHEAQHQETILQTIMLMTSETYVPPSRRRFGDAGAGGEGQMVEVPEGPFDMGAPAGGFAYDNERPRHRAETGRFEIGRYPVTNREYVEFIAAGGYEERALWSEEGWEWKRSSRLAAPLYWSIRGHGLEFGPAEAREASRADGADAWDRTTSLGTEPLAPVEPVIHVCQHEAAAFARFSGGRLPTETEWEKAAAWDPGSGASQSCPWGDREATPEVANLNAAAFGPAPIGSFPGGRSPVGCEQMLGDVWEWTSTPFAGYDGFEAFPYPEYSEVFFGDEYTVLRGASWATDAGVARNTFRNWDYPIRRQIFAGLRIARSAER